MNKSYDLAPDWRDRERSPFDLPDNWYEGYTDGVNANPDMERFYTDRYYKSGYHYGFMPRFAERHGLDAFLMEGYVMEARTHRGFVDRLRGVA